MKQLICYSLLLMALPAFAQTIKARQYKMGEKNFYKLTSESYNNGSFTGKSVSTARLMVVSDSGHLAEEIQWLGKIFYTKKDTINKDSIAQSVVPYRISLLPDAKVLLPPLTIPDMVGDITDLNTFFVALAPAMNMQQLSGKNKEWINEKLVTGNFGDGKQLLFGRDYIQVTQHLLRYSANEAMVRTDFMPPAVFSMDTLVADTIAKRTFESPNNFVMIQKGAGDKVNLLWGVESFSITSRISNTSGQLLEATMTNTLKLQMRFNCTADLKSYAAEIPVVIKRELKLEKIKKESR